MLVFGSAYRDFPLEAKLLLYLSDKKPIAFRYGCRGLSCDRARR